MPKLTKPILAILALSEWRVFRFLQFSSIPDETDVLDAGDVVEGLGEDGWRRVEWVVFLGKRYMPKFIDELVIRQAHLRQQ